MNIENIIEYIGYGRFHKRFVYMMAFVSAMGGIHSTITVFLLYGADYRCSLSGVDNDTFEVQNVHHHDLINLTIPDGKHGQCHRYDVGANTTFLGDQQANSETKCDSWVYDKSVVSSSMVTEFNLVCDDTLMIAHAQMVYFAGFLVGASGFGILGDMIGRRITTLIGQNIAVVCLFILPWIPMFYLFLVLRFVIGACLAGAYCNSFGIVLEIMPKDKRVFASTVMVLAWPLGCIVNAILAYFIRDWRYIQLAAAIPCILLLAYYWILPESIRWLVAKGKTDEANKMIQKIAKMNGVDMSGIEIQIKEQKTKTESILNVFVEPVLLMRFLILGINWISITMVYYGLILNSGSIGGDVYLNYGISNISEMIGYCIIIFFTDRLGRKKLHIILMMTTGIACISTMFPVMYDREGLHALTITLSMIGKMAVSAAFQLVYIYTPEMFPTTLRISVLGSSSCLARIGSIAAPYIGEIGKLVEGDIGVALPLIIFGAFTMVSGLLCVFIPETLGMEMPADVEAAKALKRSTPEPGIVKPIELVQMKNVAT